MLSLDHLQAAMNSAIDDLPARFGTLAEFGGVIGVGSEVNNTDNGYWFAGKRLQCHPSVKSPKAL